MSMIHRQGNIVVNDSGNADLGQSYSVTVYSRGAISTQTVTNGTTVSVRRGHAFRIGDVFMVGVDTTMTNTVTDKTATSLTWAGAMTFGSGSILLNLGQDSMSSGTPDYDGSPMKIYPSEGTTTAWGSATVVSDSSTANYEFYYHGDGMAWELIRDSSGTPLEVARGWSGLPRLNVIDYGAAGDATTDDTAAINAAFLAVNTAGDQVYFPRATYDCDPATIGETDEGTLVVAEGCHILLDGATLVLASAAASETDGMLITGTFTRIEGRGNARIQASRSLDHATNYSMVRFTDTAERLDGCGVSGTRLYLAVTGTDANLTMSGVRVDAVTSGRGTDGFYYDENFVTVTAANNPALADLRGVYLYNFIGTADNTQILLDSKVRGNTFSACDGVSVGGFAPSGVVVSDNIFRDINAGNSAGGGGISLSGVTGLAIEGNIIKSGSTGSGTGITLSRAGFSAGDLEVTDFSIVGNTITQENSSQSDHGMYISSGTDGAIVGNVCKSTVSVAGQMGIWLDDPSAAYPNDVLVEGNVCTGWNGSTSCGIRVDTAVVNARVTGNYASDNATDFNLISTTTRASNNFGNLSLRLEGTTAGITAEPSGVQGDVPLVSEINEVSTVATNGDSVTLPAAVAGQRCVVINTASSKSMKIFPASGDNAGAGANNPISIAANSMITFYAYDSTNWKGTEVVYETSA